jgi:hypothetical protein
MRTRFAISASVVPRAEGTRRIPDQPGAREMLLADRRLGVVSRGVVLGTVDPRQDPVRVRLPVPAS